MLYDRYQNQVDDRLGVIHGVIQTYYKKIHSIEFDANSYLKAYLMFVGNLSIEWSNAHDSIVLNSYLQKTFGLTLSTTTKAMA